MSNFSVGASKEAIAEARLAINDILSISGVDQSTRVTALQVLSTLCAVNNTSLINCTAYSDSGATSSPTNPPEPSESL